MDPNKAFKDALDSKVGIKAYDDVLSNPGKKLSDALCTVLDVGNTILWPIKWANERTRIYFQSNLDKYQRKLEQIPEEKLLPVQPEIAIPILERFARTSNEELSTAFVNLLTSASSSDTAKSAHPGFIQLIDRLSVDEAKILAYLSNQFEFDGGAGLACLTVRKFEKQRSQGTYRFVLRNQTLVQQRVKGLSFPSNDHLYLDNLEALGVLKLVERYPSSFIKDFESIEKVYVNTIDAAFGDQSIKSKTMDTSRHMYLLTDFGEMFIGACIK